MEHAADPESAARRRSRLIERLDQMVSSGRVTQEEAERLRAAEQPNEFDKVVGVIRRRHAKAHLDRDVDDGVLSSEEAKRIIERLESGQHPRVLRAELASLRAPSRRARREPGSLDEM